MEQSPQIEQGFIKIACGGKDNDVLMALVKAGLSGLEYQVCLYVIRKTWGYNQKDEIISLSDFAEHIGSSRRSVTRTIAMLEQKKILVRKKVTNNMLRGAQMSIYGGSLYSFNKRFINWTTDSEQPVVKQVIKPAEKPVIKKVIVSGGDKHAGPASPLACVLDRDHLEPIQIWEAARKANCKVIDAVRKYFTMVGMIKSGMFSSKGKYKHHKNFSMTLINWLKMDLNRHYIEPPNETEQFIDQQRHPSKDYNHFWEKAFGANASATP